MNSASTGRLIISIAILAFVGQVGVAGAADEPKKHKKVIKTPVSLGQPDKVAKSQSCSGTTPKIKKVTPDEGTTGDKITISGENFGQPGCISGISFGPGSPAKFTQRDGGTVSVTVPEGKRGLELLTLTGFTGEDSKPFLRK